MDQKLARSIGNSIYNYDSRLSSAMRMVSRETSGPNCEIIAKYDRLMVTEGLAKATRCRTLQLLLNLTRFLGKDWGEATPDDIEGVVVSIHEHYADDRGKETNTSYDHKKVLKAFYRWFKLGSRKHHEVGDPPETAQIRLRPVADKISRESLITEDDLTRLLHACCGNQRDRAFIDCQYEAGTRPGEILSLQIRHVKFDEHGAVISVDGKTGSRQIRLIRSVPNLSQWLNSHPMRDDPEAPLWIDLGTRHYGRPMTYVAARKMVQTRCGQARINKRIYLNLFRHSEATSTATYLTEAQMRKRHGWNPASKMPSRYVHLVNADVDEAILQHHGIKKEKKAPGRMPRGCHVCRAVNAAESATCLQCGMPLDLEAATKMAEGTRAELAEAKRQLGEVLAQTRRHEKMFAEQSKILRDLARPATAAPRRP